MYDQNQVYRTNVQFDREVGALNQQINVGMINNVVTAFFENFLRIYEHDLERTKKVIRFNRNLLLDVIPKIMLMYSSDRQFVGEMIYVMANIYSQCTSKYRPHLDMYCQLVVEKTLSYYFSGRVYGTNTQLESYYLNHVLRGRGNSRDPDGGIPLSVLVQKEPIYYLDTFVNPVAFDLNVLMDYMFFGRNWAVNANSFEEVLAQREFLLTLLPVIPIQVRSFDHSP